MANLFRSLDKVCEGPAAFVIFLIGVQTNLRSQ